MNEGRVEVIKGDIANQNDVEAVVNAANAELKIGGGVAGALHRKAGPGLEEESSKLAPIKPGKAVITNAYNLPNSKVIHTLGPVYGRDEPGEELLRKCYENSIRLAKEYGIKTIAFPAISTGAFGYPFKPAVKIALEELQRNESLEIVRLVLFSEEEYEDAKKILESID